jgi:hypothetical protein
MSTDTDVIHSVKYISSHNLCCLLANKDLSCVTFWVVHRRMVFNSRRFGKLFVLHRHRQVVAKFMISHPLAYEDGTDTVFRNVGY